MEYTNPEAMLETYTADFNYFKRKYESLSEQDKLRYKSSYVEYYDGLTQLRDLEAAVNVDQNSFAQENWQQKALLFFFLGLCVVELLIDESITIVLIALTFAYLLSEIRKMRSSTKIELKKNQINNIEKRLSLIGPDVGFFAVRDWQNSFNAKSEFYQHLRYGSLQAELLKESSLMKIKCGLLAKYNYDGLTLETFWLREGADYDNPLAATLPQTFKDNLTDAD